MLGLWHGATENSAVVSALLEDLQSRGLDPAHRILVVMDGSKALRKGVEKVLGDRAVVQRCRLHKQRNVMDHLPEEKQTQALWRLRSAWDKKDPALAEKELRKIVQWLEGFSPMAARSLSEGMEETLTLQKLGIGHTLGRCLANTNLIESCFSRIKAMMGRVTRWRDGEMILRWAAGALLYTEKRFRRINGCPQLRDLEEALTEKANVLKAA